MPIHCQYDINPSTIRCRSSANPSQSGGKSPQRGRRQFIGNPIQHKSISNWLAIDSQFIPNLMSVHDQSPNWFAIIYQSCIRTSSLCQPSANPWSVHQTIDNPWSICQLFRDTAPKHQSHANPSLMPVQFGNKIPIYCLSANPKKKCQSIDNQPRPIEQVSTNWPINLNFWFIPPTTDSPRAIHQYPSCNPWANTVQSASTLPLKVKTRLARIDTGNVNPNGRQSSI